jgi:hypothetical protein
VNVMSEHETRTSDNAQETVVHGGLHTFHSLLNTEQYYLDYWHGLVMSYALLNVLLIRNCCRKISEEYTTWKAWSQVDV